MGDQVRSVRVRMTADVAGYVRDQKLAAAATKSTARELDGISSSSRRAESDLDKVSSRVRLLGQAAVTLGPALVPISAIGIPAAIGLASGFGAAAAGAGTLLLAAQGVGTALKAMEKARINPTVENLQAAKIAMEGLSPAARGFIRDVERMVPELTQLRDTAAEGLFPGVTAGLDAVETQFPRFQRILGGISGELGSIAERAGESFASDRWTPFLDFIGEKAPTDLDLMATSFGNVSHAAAELLMGTNDLSDGFLSWLTNATGDLDRWAASATKTEGYRELVEYIHTNGPQVAETLGAIANAALQIVEAAAPLGGPVLKSVEVLAKVLGGLADSDLGTPIFTALAAMSLYDRALKLTGGLQNQAFGSPAVAQIRAAGSSIRSLAADVAVLARAERGSSASPGAGFIGPLTEAQSARANIGSTIKQYSKYAGLIAGIGLASTGAADKIGFANTASLALAGTWAGAPGAAVGAAAGLLLDAADASNQLSSGIDAVNHAVKAGDIESLKNDIQSLRDQAADASHISSPLDALGDLKTNFFGGDWRNNLKAIPIAGSYLQGLFGRGKSAAQGFGAAADDAQTQLDKLTHAAATDAYHAIGGLGDVSKLSAGEVDQLTRRLQQSQEAATSTENSFLQFGSSLSDSKVSLHDWITQLDQQASALAHFGTNAKAAADKGLRAGLIKQLQAAGAQGALRMKQLANASGSEIARANHAWALGRQAIRQYNALVVPRKNVDVNTGPAVAKVNALIRLLAGIPSSVKVPKAPRTPAAAPSDPTQPGPNIEIPGLHATGGLLRGPGTSTSDSIPAYLSNGEYVVKAAAVSKYGVAMFDHMNAMRFSGGGSVDDTPDSVLGSLYGPKSGGHHSNSGTTHHTSAQSTAVTEHARHSVEKFQKALDRATAALDKEKSAREDLISKRDDLRSTVSDSLQSQLFGTDRGSTWQYLSAADRKRLLVSGVMSTLTKDNANIQATSAAEKQLKLKGLDGQAYAALVGSGDLEAIQAFASLSKGELAQFESAFNLRGKGAAAAGVYAGDVVYKAAIDKETAVIQRMAKDVAGLRDDVRHASHHVTSRGKASRGATATATRTRKKAG